MTTQFKPTPRTVCDGILMFADTRNYIAAEYPGLIDQIREAVKNDKAFKVDNVAESLRDLISDIHNGGVTSGTLKEAERVLKEYERMTQ